MKHGWHSAIVLTVIILLPAAHATASETHGGTRGGLYMGADIGASIPHDLKSTRLNTGIPTNCDQWLDDATLPSGDTVPLPLSQCAPRSLPSSPNTFDLSTGFLAGFSIGYALPYNLRVEAEYFHQRSNGGRSDLIVPGDPKQQEFVQRSEQIGAVRKNSVFANLYYDFHNMISPRLTPYVGAGLGLTHMAIRYSATSIRTSNRQTLIDLGRNPNAAGTESRADETLSDTLFGYQVMAGLDYALSEQLMAGIKLRYGNAFGDFSDGDKAWKPLRSHESTVGPGGAPVRYGIDADGLGFWGISLSLRYYL